MWNTYDEWKALPYTTDQYGDPPEVDECPCGCGIDYKTDPEGYKEAHKQKVDLPDCDNCPLDECDYDKNEGKCSILS